MLALNLKTLFSEGSLIPDRDNLISDCVGKAGLPLAPASTLSFEVDLENMLQGVQAGGVDHLLHCIETCGSASSFGKLVDFAVRNSGKIRALDEIASWARKNASAAHALIPYSNPAISGKSTTSYHELLHLAHPDASLREMAVVVPDGWIKAGPRYSVLSRYCGKDVVLFGEVETNNFGSQMSTSASCTTRLLFDLGVNHYISAGLAEIISSEQYAPYKGGSVGALMFHTDGIVYSKRGTRFNEKEVQTLMAARYNAIGALRRDAALVNIHGVGAAYYYALNCSDWVEPYRVRIVTGTGAFHDQICNACYSYSTRVKCRGQYLEVANRLGTISTYAVAVAKKKFEEILDDIAKRFNKAKPIGLPVKSYVEYVMSDEDYENGKQVEIPRSIEPVSVPKKKTLLPKPQPIVIECYDEDDDDDSTLHDGSSDDEDEDEEGDDDEGMSDDIPTPNYTCDSPNDAVKVTGSVVVGSSGVKVNPKAESDQLIAELMAAVTEKPMRVEEKEFFSNCRTRLAAMQKWASEAPDDFPMESLTVFLHNLRARELIKGIPKVSVNVHQVPLTDYKNGYEMVNAEVASPLLGVGAPKIHGTTCAFRDVPVEKYYRDDREPVKLLSVLNHTLFRVKGAMGGGLCFRRQKESLIDFHNWREDIFVVPAFACVFFGPTVFIPDKWSDDHCYISPVRRTFMLNSGVFAVDFAATSHCPKKYGLCQAVGVDERGRIHARLLAVASSPAKIMRFAASVDFKDHYMHTGQGTMSYSVDYVSVMQLVVPFLAAIGKKMK